MPTPPRSYSPSAAEKLRLALLALVAATATGCDNIDNCFRTTGAWGTATHSSPPEDATLDDPPEDLVPDGEMPAEIVPDSGHPENDSSAD